MKKATKSKRVKADNIKRSTIHLSIVTSQPDQTGVADLIIAASKVTIWKSALNCPSLFILAINILEYISSHNGLLAGRQQQQELNPPV